MMALSLNESLRAQVEARGIKTALSFDGETRSYTDLDRHACQIANGLMAQGIAPGDRVAYLGKNTLAYFEWLLGAAKARAVTVPVNWRLAETEVRGVFANARPKLILVEPAFENTAAHVAPSTERLVTGGPNDTFGAWRDAQRHGPVNPTVDAAEPVLQLYTSGTTGQPKGVVLTHRSLLSLRSDPDTLPDWYRWSAEDVSLIAMPVAHISGTGWGIWTLQHGATGVILREFDAHTLFEQLVSRRVTKIMMVPTAMQIAVRHPRAKTTDLSFLRHIFYGGAPLPLDLMQECAEVFGCGFVQMYGMTETAGTIAALAPEDHDPRKGDRLRSVGKALPGVELKIMTADGRTQPTGAIGEIAIRTPANMAGYFELPQATSDTLDADGWLRSGDAGYLDQDGFLFLKDRVKDMIISGGENIYPAEVENAIYGHPAVSEVAVVGVPDEKWGETVQAFVVLKAGAAPSEREIIDSAGTRIARFKLPKAIQFVTTLPRNHAGKVLRRELRKTSPRL